MIYQTQISFTDDAVRIRWTPLRLLEDSANVLIPAAVAGVAIAGGAVAAPGVLTLLVIPALAATVASGWRYRGREWIVIVRGKQLGAHGDRGRVLEPRDVDAVELAAGTDLLRTLGYRCKDSDADAVHIFLHVRGVRRPEWIFARPRKQATVVSDLASQLASWLHVPLHGVPLPESKQ